jgi:hypothetical protein
MVNGLPALASRTGNRVQTAAIVGIVDITQPFFVELLMSPSGTEYLLYQLNAGGMTVYYDTTVSYVQLYTYTAALGVARYITSPVGSWLARSFKHVIGYVDPVGLSGKWWMNGVPVLTSFVNTAPPVPCAATAFCLPGVVGAPTRSLIARVWQGTPSNEDCAALYGAARALTGGEV